jgi:hypothetical protein
MKFHDEVAGGKTKFNIITAGILKLKGIRLLTAGSVPQPRPRVLTFFVLNTVAVRQFYVVKYLDICLQQNQLDALVSQIYLF